MNIVYFVIVDRVCYFGESDGSAPLGKIFWVQSYNSRINLHIGNGKAHIIEGAQTRSVDIIYVSRPLLDTSCESIYEYLLVVCSVVIDFFVGAVYKAEPVTMLQCFI